MLPVSTNCLPAQLHFDGALQAIGPPYPTVWSHHGEALIVSPGSPFEEAYQLMW